MLMMLFYQSQREHIHWRLHRVAANKYFFEQIDHFDKYASIADHKKVFFVSEECYKLLLGRFRC